MTSVHAMSDRGLVRESNQDVFFSNYQNIFAVADGMGGYHNGTVAAQDTIEAIEFVSSEISEAAVAGKFGQVHELVDEAVRRSHFEIRSRSNKDRIISGTTVTVCVWQDARLTVLWAGDTRAFALEGEVIKCVNSVHTVAAEKALTGRGHLVLPNDHHTLTRCIGINGYEPLEIADHQYSLAGKRGLIVCSDGYDVVTPDEILECFGKSSDAEAWLDALAKIVMSRGAPDNFSAVGVIRE